MTFASVRMSGRARAVAVAGLAAVAAGFLGSGEAEAQFSGALVEGIELVLEGAPPDRAAAILQDSPAATTVTPAPVDRSKVITQLPSSTLPSTGPSISSAGPRVLDRPGQGLPVSPNVAVTQPGVSITNPSPPKATTAAPPTGNRTLFSDHHFLSNARLCGMLAEPGNRAAVNIMLRDMLSAQVKAKLPSGFGIHSRTNHQLGDNCTARAEIIGNRITVTTRVPRNRYFAQITTPGPLGSDADPNFHIFYDIEARATFLLPSTTGGRLVQESAHVSATNVTRPASNNIISKIALAVNDLVKFVGGPDFVSRLRQDRNYKFGSFVSIDLGGLNNALGGAAPTLRLEQSFKGQVLVLLATSRPQPAGPIVK